MDHRHLQVRFTSDAQQLLVYIKGGVQEATYSGRIHSAEQLPSLPEAISSDTPVEQIASQYQEFFRKLRRRSSSGHGPNAMERIFSHIGDPSGGTVQLQFVADDNCLWASVRPWELLLHDDVPDQLQDRLIRVAAVRSLNGTDLCSPRRIDGKLRALLLQGADGPRALDFEGERLAIESAWEALGPTLQAYVDRPVIRPAMRSKIVSNLVEIRPHLLWFSGHGQLSDNDFMLLLGHGAEEDWAPASVFRDALLQAADVTSSLPMVVAFWACESGRAPGPSLDAGQQFFPVLVSSILLAGVEAVMGVQTRIYNTSARIMGTELFRSLAEGIGPAQSLASARARLLAMPRDRTARGRNSEWTSPVMWISGVSLPAVEWGRPLGADEALAFHRIGTESLLAFEGGYDILEETLDAEAASEAASWVRESPMWLTCPDLDLADRHLEVIRRLANVVLSENRTVLIFRFDSIHHYTILDAVAKGMRDIQLRAYAKPSNEAWDLLASLFEAFKDGAKRRDAWRELLDRKDMIVAIIAPGGLPSSDGLEDAKSAKGSLLVFSSRNPEDLGNSSMSWDGWRADDFDPDGAIPMMDNEALTEFLTAFAILNKPLSEAGIADLGQDFDLDPDNIPRALFTQLGQRYVVKASVARSLLEALSPEKKRAAHRACMGLLERARDEFNAPKSKQLVWQVNHALQAEETVEAQKLASRAIRQLASQGRHQDVVEVFRSLNAARRGLDVESRMDVASAFIQMGQPRAAYDLLRQVQVTPTSILKKEVAAARLRYSVLMAEALRNMNMPETGEQSIAILEDAINAHSGVSSLPHEARRQLLIAQHDLGRNVHYFREDTLRACTIFHDVISACGDAPHLAYLKAAAYRNWADALDRYTYGKVERDPAAAEQHMREAVRIARAFTEARPLLPEMLYILAKYEHATKPGEARRDIRDAIDLARENGASLILTIAKNKLFWWRVGPLRPENPPSGFDFREWARLERELEFLVGHAWALRVLIDSRLGAAKCLSLLGRIVDAARILERARDLLIASQILQKGEGDWIHRWQPVYAGLAVLSQPANKPVRSGEMDMWADLRAVALDRSLPWETGTKDVTQIWEEVS